MQKLFGPSSHSYELYKFMLSTNLSSFIRLWLQQSSVLHDSIPRGYVWNCPIIYNHIIGLLVVSFMTAYWKYWTYWKYWSKMLEVGLIKIGVANSRHTAKFKLYCEYCTILSLPYLMNHNTMYLWDSHQDYFPEIRTKCEVYTFKWRQNKSLQFIKLYSWLDFLLIFLLGDLYADSNIKRLGSSLVNRITSSNTSNSVHVPITQISFINKMIKQYKKHTINNVKVP